MESKLQISFGFCIFVVFLILFLPIQWCFSVILAGIIHELFHMAAVLLCGGNILSISLSFTGAKIDTGPLTPQKQALCALAGPLGSFLILPLAYIFPELTLCGLIQGAYNLLPIYPMDGGRALRAVFPEPVCKGIETSSLVILSGISLWIAAKNLQFGLAVLFSVWHPAIQRKISCKEGNLAVQ